MQCVKILLTSAVLLALPIGGIHSQPKTVAGDASWTDRFFLPQKTARTWVHVRFTPADKLEFQRIKASLIAHIMEHYSEKTLQPIISGILIQENVWLQDTEVGGTFEESTIFIACGSAAGSRLRDTDCRVVFDSELANIVLRRWRSQFPEKAWLAINPVDFKYGQGGVDAILTGRHSQVPNTSWLGKGFVHQYATASLEEDVSAIAELLFSHKTDGEYWGKKHPPIAAKMRLLGDFYVKCVPEFKDPLRRLTGHPD